MLAAGAEINAYLLVHAHGTALHQAVANGDLPMIEMLLGHGARTDIAETMWDGTAHDWAIYGNNAAAAAALEVADDATGGEGFRPMTTLDTISHDRTKFCRKAMKAHNGVWNLVTTAWMFRNAGDHANALCELYRATRPSVAQLETLLAMAADGTGAQAWDFDPIVGASDYATLRRDDASRLLSAGYAVRRLLGTHPLENVPVDVPSKSSMPRRSRHRAIVLPSNRARRTRPRVPIPNVPCTRASPSKRALRSGISRRGRAPS